MKISKLILGLTYRCQAACPHCSAGRYPVRRSDELTGTEVRAVIAAAARLGARTVNLFGGEPTLRDDFSELAAFAAGRIPEVVIDTNGIGFTPEMAGRLAAARVALVYVSLYGPCPADHDAFVGHPGAFAAAVAAIGECRRLGMAVHVSTCAVKGYIDSGRLEGIIAAARGSGAGGVRIALPMCSGNWLGNETALLGPDEAARVRRLAGDGYVSIVEEEEGAFTRCKAVTGGSLYVSPYGDVQPCNFIPLSYGNVRREPLELILERMSSDSLFLGDHQRGECPMRRPEIARGLGGRLDPLSRLALVPGPATLATGCDCRLHADGCGPHPGPRALAELLVELAALDPATPGVDIVGGEPADHPDIVALVAACAAGGRTVCLHTSALPFAAAPGLAAELARAGCRVAEVPLEEGGAGRIDGDPTGAGRRQPMLAGVDRLLDAGIEVRLTLFERDRRRLAAAVAELRRRGVQVVLLGRRLAGAPARPGVCRLAPADPGVVRTVAWSWKWQPEDPVGEGFDVLLLYPDCESVDPVVQLPMPLLALATPLVRAGVRVGIVDQRVDPRWRDAVVRAVGRGLRCVGISCFAGRQVGNALEMARFVRTLQGDLPIVWGGMLPSLLPRQTLAHPHCDVVVRGEGEESFAELVGAFGSGRDLAGLAGIAFKRPDGTIVENPDRSPPDLDRLPPIDYDLVDVAAYERRGLLWALYTSRGCPHRCGFCSVAAVHRRRWRGQSAARVLAEFDRLRLRGVSAVNICEDNFFVDRKRVLAIGRGLIRRGSPFCWTASARISDLMRLDDRTLRLLRRAGLGHLHIGAESGSVRMLDLVQKGVSPDDILTANRRLRAAGIVPEFIFMSGFPTESEADRTATQELAAAIRRDNPDAWFWRMNRYIPYPGTPLYELALREGFVPPDDLAGWAALGWSSPELETALDYQVGF